MDEATGNGGYYGEGWRDDDVVVHVVIIIAAGDIHAIHSWMRTTSTATVGGGGDNGKTCPNLGRLAALFLIFLLYDESRQIIAGEDGEWKLRLNSEGGRCLAADEAWRWWWWRRMRQGGSHGYIDHNDNTGVVVASLPAGSRTGTTNLPFDHGVVRSSTTPTAVSPTPDIIININIYSTNINDGNETISGK